MSELLHQFIANSAARHSGRVALIYKKSQLTYQQLWDEVVRVGNGLINLGLSKGTRVAVYLPKQPETIAALFGTLKAGGVMVPVNPLLKPAQLQHILNDCSAEFLVTSRQRYQQCAESLLQVSSLKKVLLIDDEENTNKTIGWHQLNNKPVDEHRRINNDVAALLYTSGSTGAPKGVVLSHTNIVEGAKSVAHYLGSHKDDRLLAVLPLSFDYGLNQITTSFFTGASVVLMEYLLPRDVIRAVEKYQITGLAAVPPLWVQLARLEWPETTRCLRYITNSGGAMPQATLQQLRQKLPQASPFLMYGLTEAFRSTYLDPSQVDIRPTSIGKAIPNAEILVLRENGSHCDANEEGELVHRGIHVSQGYWNAPDKTAERFRKLPEEYASHPNELAVWSGDTVTMDEEGFLYFIGRKDDMIKSSGYRISPSELEEVLYAHEDIAEVAAFGIAHEQLGQAVVLAVKPQNENVEEKSILQYCAKKLPNFMQPKHIAFYTELPRNANGKIDRVTLAAEHATLFTEQQ